MTGLDLSNSFSCFESKAKHWRDLAIPLAQSFDCTLPQCVLFYLAEGLALSDPEQANGVSWLSNLNVWKRYRRGKPMTDWTPEFNISTVPDDILLTENARRLRARQVVAPRPKVLRQCPHCFQPFGARELRKHAPCCPHRENLVDSPRAGWTLRKVTDPEEQDARTYRSWQSLPAGDRIVATWELSEAAYSIQKIGHDVSEGL
jgi:hypothetical protein